MQSVEDMLASPFWGSIWETFVFAELRKREVFRNSAWSIQFLRDRMGEVDFVIDRGGRFELYDAKDRDPADGRRRPSASTRFRPPSGEKHVLRSTLICRAANRHPLTLGATRRRSGNSEGERSGYLESELARLARHPPGNPQPPRTCFHSPSIATVDKLDRAPGKAETEQR